jgi:uncharacterized protein
MRIPSDEQIRGLHEKHAPTWAAFERVYAHCEIVCGIAEQLLARAGSDLDADLVRAGGLLHESPPLNHCAKDSASPTSPRLSMCTGTP